MVEERPADVRAGKILFKFRANHAVRGAADESCKIHRFSFAKRGPGPSCSKMKSVQVAEDGQKLGFLELVQSDTEAGQRSVSSQAGISRRAFGRRSHRRRQD